MWRKPSDAVEWVADFHRGVHCLSTPPQTSKGVGVSACDKFSVSAYGYWTESKWAEFESKLSAAKESAQRYGGAQVVEWEGYEIEVLASGHKAGDGGPYYAYTLRRHGVRLAISRKRESVGTMPNVIVEIGATALHAYAGDEFAAWEATVRFLAAIGYTLTDDRLSRVDICSDLVDVEVQEFIDLWRDRAMVYRAKKATTYGDDSDAQRAAIIEELEQRIREVRAGALVDCEFTYGSESTGLKIGSDIQCRMYDKLREVQRDPVKFNLMIRDRWGGEVPDASTRVEFQVNSKGLRRRGIATVADWREKRSAVVRWLAEEWLVVRQPGLDRNHRKNSPVNETWRKVQRGFVLAYFGKDGSEKPVEHQPAKRMLRPDLRAGARGYVASMLACEQGAMTDEDGTLNPERVAEAVETLVIEACLGSGMNAFARDVETKSNRFDHKYGVRPIDQEDARGDRSAFSACYRGGRGNADLARGVDVPDAAVGAAFGVSASSAPSPFRQGGIE